MAQVTISYDTVEKSLAVTVDGQAVANVVGIDFYQSYDKDDYRFELTTGIKDEANDTWSMTRVVASETPAGQTNPTPSAIPGFNQVGNTLVQTPAISPDVEKAIQDYFAPAEPKRS